MELQNPGLYKTWVAIQQGQTPDPGTTIRSDFGGDYVFSDLDHGEFLTRAFQDPNLEEIYRDDYAIIFKVTD